MHKEKTFLAIIPARCKSKRLPGKNIIDFNGLPLIVHSIRAAKNSRYVDNVVVTSDDLEILNISKNEEAEIIKRPEELASDTATTFDTVKHVINYYKHYEFIVLLQPTSPLRTDKHIDEAIRLLERKKADAIISVCKMSHTPLWSNTLSSDLSMKNFLKDNVKNKRSQDFEAYYRLNGSIYICRMDKFLENNGFFLNDNIYAYEMNRESSVDIDEEIDFKIAKAFLE